MTTSYHVSEAFLDALYAWRKATNDGDLEAIERTYTTLTTYVAMIEARAFKDGQGVDDFKGAPGTLRQRADDAASPTPLPFPHSNR